VQQADRRGRVRPLDLGLNARSNSHFLLAEQVGSARALIIFYQERSKRVQELSQIKKQSLLSALRVLATPLNHIIGYLQLTIDDQADDPIEERDFMDRFPE